MPIPGEYEFVNYEEKAVEALRKGRVAEAQVWATLHHAEALTKVSDRLDSLNERLI